MNNRFFYLLLQNGQLNEHDPEFLSIKNDASLLESLEAAAADFDCQLVMTRNALYLVPTEDNQFLGFSKADLKKRLLKSEQTDVHYYLLMFILLILLDAFFSTDYGEGKARSFLTLGDWMNRVEAALSSDSLQNKNPGNIPYEQMQDTYKNLLSEMNNSRKGTKRQLFDTLIRFLQEQNLANYSSVESQIYVTDRMEALMAQILSNSELLEIFEAVPDVPEQSDRHTAAKDEDDRESKTSKKGEQTYADAQ